MRTNTTTLMTRIQEGMDVYDSTGNKIGTVEAIQFGEEDLSKLGVETETAIDYNRHDATLIEDIANAFRTPSQMPIELRSRLLRYGFIKIGGGLLHMARYAEADQIEKVTSDSIVLNAKRSELISG